MSRHSHLGREQMGNEPQSFVPSSHGGFQQLALLTKKIEVLLHGGKLREAGIPFVREKVIKTLRKTKFEFATFLSIP